jgi:hypothetical protein
MLPGVGHWMLVGLSIMTLPLHSHQRARRGGGGLSAGFSRNIIHEVSVHYRILRIAPYTGQKVHSRNPAAAKANVISTSK